MKRIARAVLVTGALLSSVLVASTTGNAAAGDSPPTLNSFYESIPMTVNGDYTPIFGLACGEEDTPFILWYAPGPAADYVWSITSLSPLEYESAPMPVNGTYEPIIGDFDDNGCDDILWYAPGGASDFIWWGEANGSFTSEPITINGSYVPAIGHFDGQDPVDIFWYAPGGAAEYFWLGGGDRTFTSKSAPAVNGTYEMTALGDRILFHRPGPAMDYQWDDVDAVTGTHSTTPVQINGSYDPEMSVVGFLLYAAGTAPDYLMYDIDEHGKPETLSGTINGTYADDVRSLHLYYLHVWHSPGAGQDYLWIPEGLYKGADVDAMAEEWSRGDR